MSAPFPKPSRTSSEALALNQVASAQAGPFLRRRRGLKWRRHRLVYRPGQASVSAAEATLAIYEASGRGARPISYTPTGKAARDVRIVSDVEVDIQSIRAVGFTLDLLETEPA